MRTLVNGLAIVLVTYLAVMLYLYAELVGIIALALFSVAAIGFIVITFLYGIERVKMIRANRQAKEREANLMVTVAPAGSMVFRTVTNDYSAVTSPLHLEPGWINGQSEPVTIEQHSRWLLDKSFNAQIRSSSARHMLPEPERELKPVIELIRNEPCIAVWGGRGSGKTTHALHWLAYSRNENYVIDPKPLGLNPWPNSKVIGSNGQFDEVEPSVKRIYNELLHRQQNGLLNEQPITLLVDELYTLTMVHKLAIMDWIFAIITLGREYGVNASFTSSAKGVKALGIEGMSGLAEALTFVHLIKNGDDFRAYVDLGQGEIECLPCGPYIASEQTPRMIGASIPMSEEETIKKVVMDNAGASFGEVKRLAGMDHCSRPTAFKRIKEVIEKFDLQSYEIGGTFPVKE